MEMTRIMKIVIDKTSYGGIGYSIIRGGEFKLDFVKTLPAVLAEMLMKAISSLPETIETIVLIGQRLLGINAKGKFCYFMFLPHGDKSFLAKTLYLTRWYISRRFVRGEDGQLVCAECRTPQPVPFNSHCSNSFCISHKRFKQIGVPTKWPKRRTFGFLARA